jgi:large subunit ribosomal protein L15
MLKAGGDHFGRRGFKRPQKMVYANTTMNIGELAERLDTLVSEGSASKAGDRYSVDLTALGIDKLLGNGSIEACVDVVVSEASAGAREKLETAGGSLVD